jgi:hypothetical protein
MLQVAFSFSFDKSKCALAFLLYVDHPWLVSGLTSALSWNDHQIGHSVREEMISKSCKLPVPNARTHIGLHDYGLAH